MLRITPVFGSRWSSVGEAVEPQCTLVEYANVRVLWNVGWWESSSSSIVRAGGTTSGTAAAARRFPVLPPHDVLILTDSTLQSSGGLPLYHQQYPETTVYATFPTVKMGQMTLYDAHAALTQDGKKPSFTLQDVDDAFARVTCIKYSQSMLLPRDDRAIGTTKPASTVTPTLSITAQRAGHVVGGAFYLLHRLQDDTSIVLTSTYHIAKELHLDSSTLLEYGSTPDVLVTQPGGPAFRQFRTLAHNGPKPSLPPVLVTQAERNLVDGILAVLRREGNVLLPVDAAGRVLELVLLLNRHWEKQRLGQTYNLVWVAPMVVNTLEFAKSQLEWMASQLTQQFDSMFGHPYLLRHVHLCTSMRELDLFLEENPNPSCVLATGLSLEGGPARDILLQWADNADHSIIFTDSSQCYLRRKPATSSTVSHDQHPEDPQINPSLTVNSTSDIVDAAATAVVVDADETSQWTSASQLLLAWYQAKLEGREMDDSVTIDVNVPIRAPLAGKELVDFLASEDAKRREQLLQREKLAMLREVEIAKGQLRLGEQETGGAAAANTTEASRGGASGTTATSTARNRPKKKSRFDSSLFIKFSKPLHLTFETREEAVGIGLEDSVPKFGIGESVGRSGEVLEDDYGIAVPVEKFTDVVSGVDPSKFAGGSGRVGEDVLRRGLGYGVDAGGSMAKRGSTRSGSARISEDEDEGDLSDKADEQAAEAIDLSEGTGIIRGRNGRPPIKVTTVIKKLEVLAEISYLPLEGRVDARAARQSVRALQPRQVVVMGGPNHENEAPDLIDEVQLLATTAFSFATDKKPIATPSDGEVAELNIGHAAYSARLVDTPYPMDVEHPAKPVEPFEVKVGACTVSILDLVATGQKVALDGSLVLAPRAESSTSNDSPQIYLSDGEVLLTDLRAELIATGMKADYSAHAGYAQLVVNGTITIKKSSDSGELEVEGPLCNDFFLVRSMVCRQFVTL